MTEIDMKFLPDCFKTMKRRIPKRFRLKKLHNPQSNLVIFDNQSKTQIATAALLLPLLKVNRLSKDECAEYVE